MPPVKTTQPGNTISVTAASALIANRFIGFAGTYPTANTKSLGVTQMAFDSGEQAAVVIDGIVLIELGGSVSAGGAIIAGSNGVGLPHSSTHIINAYALEAGGSGDVIKAKLV